MERSPRRTARKRRKLKIPSPLPWQWLLLTLELWWSGRKCWLLASLTATSSNSFSQAKSGSSSAVGSRRRFSNGNLLGSEELSNVNILTAVIPPWDLSYFTHGHQETGPTVSLMEITVTLPAVPGWSSPYQLLLIITHQTFPLYILEVLMRHNSENILKCL